MRNESDEEYAMRLNNEEMQAVAYAAHANNNDITNRITNTSPPPPASPSLYLKAGERLKVRLQHSLTGHCIGEALYAEYNSESVIQFELVEVSGKRLRVSSNGTVEFSHINDDSCRFIAVITHGIISLLSVSYRYKTNSSNEVGWYLSLSPNATLVGNAGKATAGWILINVNQSSQPLPPVPMTQMSSNALQHLISDASTMHIGTYLPSSSSAAAVVASSSVSYNSRTIVEAPLATKLEWLRSSAEGMQCLRDYPMVKQMLDDGTIKKILHRPDWIQIANRYYDMSLSFTRINFEIDDEYMPLTLKSFYFQHGYCILKNVVDCKLLSNACKILNYTISRNASTSSGTSSSSVLLKSSQQFIYSTDVTGDVRHDVDIMALFYQTPLQHIVQTLFGAGEVEPPTIASPTIVYPSYIDEAHILETFNNNTWFMEGFDDSGNHSPYTMLIGVALSDIDELYSGSISVHAGSHLTLQEHIRDEINNKATTFSSISQNKYKPRLQEPIQLQLKAGDVFMCSQKLAIQQAANLTCDSKLIVYYRISHIDHHSLKHSALDGVWVEYMNADKYLQ